MDVSSPKNDENLTENAPDESKVDNTSPRHLLLLVEDATLQALPKHVDKALQDLKTIITTESQCDLLAILIYCISLESGFVCRNAVDGEDMQNFKLSWEYSFDLRNVLRLCKLPRSFKREDMNVYYFNLNLLDHFHRDCLLTCLQTGEFLCVTLSPQGCPGKSVSLSISRYVLPIRTKSLPGRFRNLSELSYLLKDRIFTPIRISLMDELMHRHPGIKGIPAEVLYLILELLKPLDIQNLSKTCRQLREECAEFYSTKFKPKTLPLVL